MKPFAAIDLTTDKKNETANGSVFCIQKTSEALTRSFEASSQQVDKTMEKAKLPLPLRILQWICTFVGFVSLIGLLKGLGGVDSLEVAYRNAGWIFWLCGGSLLAAGLLKLLGRRQEKTVLENEDSEQLLARMEGLCKAVYNELGVPENARETDIFSFYYKDKDGKIRHVSKVAPFNYLNLVHHVYGDEENLYLANLDGKYAFPKASLKAIRTVKEHIVAATWQKDVPYNEGFYKQFQLREDDYGCIHMKRYHILELEKDGETWGIWFPCYELPTFEILTGLKAE